MSNRIPDEKVELIRRSSDIVEIISDYVQLKKQGRQYIGLCPFHGEKSPSFSVSPDKQLYHCFGCGAGGNVFSFLMELEGLSFIESVRKLGERANIALPEATDQERVVEGPQSLMRSAHELAAKLYYHVLTLTEQGSEGREYVKERGFTREQINHFQIGFAPDRWDSLVTILTKRNFSLDTMVQASLLGERESKDGYYDRFRNRLMFPIWDGQGNVIAFGGRTISDEKPKYLNSSDSPIFHKGNTLYGLHLARPSIRKQGSVVLFEGYVDVIAAWGAGLSNTIATLGTALTEEQAKVIRRNAEMVTICYDSDKAGTNAAFRSAGILEQVGCTVKVAQMPEGLDPDDYIRTYGSERFRSDVIGESLTLMSFKMRYLRKGKNMQNEAERMSYIEDVLTEIATLPRAVERDHYLRQIAEEFSISLEALKQEQLQIYRTKRNQEQNQYSSKEKPTQTRKSTFETKKLLPAHQNAERFLLAHMMRDVEVAELVQERIGGEFHIDEHQALAAHLFAYFGEGHEASPSQFIQGLQDEKLIRIATELAMMPVNEDYQEKELLDYMNLIETYPKRVQIQQKELEMKRERDPIEAARLLMEINRMKQELH
ncbi:DNA primase [Alkalihalobacillus sp. MEB130]|uniref:DNA primase n=1 Tax=Alkalihalobacillus sp. MEB130 TaxID=2976704 RepID=UPI0028DD9BE6|nr:DNA primase [Alkalihalobacillus sp. MEB130]MDT8861772.1 DNA primase [Alkalihalobacillus sp. MEB130]